MRYRSRGNTPFWADNPYEQPDIPDDGDVVHDHFSSPEPSRTPTRVAYEETHARLQSIPSVGVQRKGIMRSYEAH